jgi:hypothetical protein
VPEEDEKATFRSSARALIEEALVAIVLALDGVPATAKTKELRGRAESFERILSTWDASGPNGLRLETVGEGVSKLHDQVLTVVADASRTTTHPRGELRSRTPPRKAEP